MHASLVALLLLAPPAPMEPPPKATPSPTEHTTRLELAHAATLLAAPVGTPEPTPAEPRWVAVRDAIHQTAIRWELMDPREERYLLATREDFQNDLNLLRRRYQDLADAPKLLDCHRLPDLRTAQIVIRFNRDFRKNIEDRGEWEPDRADLFEQVLRETDLAYQQWDAIRDARCEWYYISERRKALRRLRDSIGADAYARGEMPPNVPLWRFRAGR